ncbi:hypothetical protein TRFO_22432 [Tritrichomonas foetus]|uniref:Flavodoxin-like domain-containing protein n=1 Tax=Tritrichomonas foetus TaxID=1144522 RepID=A0A1J4KBY0_9EUKA|nr:hypothetical protein TRFO_22432 [Tritrichomonas foetus]|eukprot:OHT08921.1 hypothetical protein TRFO_22432 [Tritrichomonas foetus]
MKALICYYSRTGVTLKAAEKIKEITGAELYEMKPVNPYPTNYLYCCYVSKKEQYWQTPIEFSELPNIDDYDTIFIGFPIWCWQTPQHILCFLEKLNLTGKRIIPFSTSGNTDIAYSVEEIKKKCPESEVTDGCSLKYRAIDSCETPIREWLQKLKVIE